MRNESEIPLLRHALDAESAFRPEKLIAAVRAERRLDRSNLPAICVLDFDGDLTDWLRESGLAQPAPSWACFHTAMWETQADGVSMGVVDRTIGGPYAVLVAEQMLADGVRVIVGLTSAGRVAATVPIPSVIVPDMALRDEGTSYHYLPPSEFVTAPERLASLLERELAAADAPVLRGPVWTTDAPYRETAEQIERHSAAGVLAVEMQAASLFALAQARGGHIGVVAHVSNTAGDGGAAAGDEGRDFDKGPEMLSYEILRAIARAGAALLREDSSDPA